MANGRNPGCEDIPARDQAFSILPSSTLHPYVLTLAQLAAIRTEGSEGSESIRFPVFQPTEIVELPLKVTWERDKDVLSLSLFRSRRKISALRK